MKLAAAFAALLLAAACDKAPSKLDQMAPAGDIGGTASAGAAPSGDLEARVRKLEKHGEALEWLSSVYEQQKAQQAEKENSEPAPDAVFAVDISQNLKLGQVEGSPSAPVTIIEAWDFA